MKGRPQTGAEAESWLAEELSLRPPCRIFAPGREHIGDAVNLTGVLAGLRQRFPDAHIVAEVGERTAAIWKGFPCADEVWLRPTRQGLKGKLGHVLRLRSAKFDLAALLDDSNDLVLQAKLGGIPRRVGIWRGRKYEQMFDAYVPLQREMHEVRDHGAAVLRLLGLPDWDPKPCLFPSDQDEAEAAAAWRSLGLTDPVVAFHPAASEPNRMWGLDRMAEAIRRVRELGAAPLLVGGPGDQVHLDWLESETGAARVPAGLGLLAFACLARRFGTMVCMDSGPMHIAAAMGCRVVAVYGPAYPSHTRPWGDGHEILEGGCSCPLRHWDTCSRACLNEVSPADVVAAVERVLSSL